MSAILMSLGVNVAKEAGKFLVKEYGDDALRLFKKTVHLKNNGSDIDPKVLEAIDDGIEQTLIELKRPYEDFFGPRIGEKDTPPPDTSKFEYFPKELDKYPDENELKSGDIIYTNDNLWTVWNPEAGTKSPQPPWTIFKTME